MTVSWAKLIFWILVCIFAVAGFLTVSPIQVWNRISDVGLWMVYRDNKEMAKIVDNVESKVENAEERVLVNEELRKRVEKLAGLDSSSSESQDSDTEDGNKEHGPNYYLGQLRSAHNTFRRFLDVLKKDSTVAARIPVIHPLVHHSIVLHRFEMVHDPFTGNTVPHRGIDYAGQTGDSVMATGAGIIEDSGNLPGWGKFIIVQHTKFISTFYAHLDAILVSEGQLVRRGQIIGLLGASGRTTGPHLHYEIRWHEKPVDPEEYFLTR